MSRPEPIVNYRITDHARNEMSRRQISEEDVAQVLAEPEQIEMVREGRMVYQSRVNLGEPAQVYMIRVFVDVDRVLPEVVTVYRTSKLTKYWRSEDESNLRS